MTDLTHLIAIGDVHGCLDELQTLLQTASIHMVENHPGAGYKFLFTGDYVDRGPKSREVVALVRNLQELGAAICLQGNHEAMVLQHAYHDIPYWDNRVQWTQDELDWMASLAVFCETNLHFFVHGGIMPTIPLKDQLKEEMQWIRHPFLGYKGPFPKYVIHGHTPVDDSPGSKPDVRHNRCNMDTGCVFGGTLSAAVFDLTKVEPIFTMSVPLTTSYQGRAGV